MDGCWFEIRAFASSMRMAARRRFQATALRCAAALLIDSGKASNEITISTGAGPKHLHLIQRTGRQFLFEMDMGLPIYQEDQVRYALPLKHGAQEVTILDVGNPQCAVLVDRNPGGLESVGCGNRRASPFSKAH